MTEYEPIKYDTLTYYSAYTSTNSYIRRKYNMIYKKYKKKTSVNALIRIIFHICKSILKRLIMWTASALKYIHRFQKALLCAYHSVILHVIVENKVTTCGYISVSTQSLSMQKHSLISMGRHSRNKSSAYQNTQWWQEPTCLAVALLTREPVSTDIETWGGLYWNN